MVARLRLEEAYDVPRSQILHQTFYKLAGENGLGPIYELVQSVAADITEIWSPWTRDIATIADEQDKSAAEVAKESQRHARIREALAIGKQHNTERDFVDGGQVKSKSVVAALGLVRPVHVNQSCLTVAFSQCPCRRYIVHS